MIDTPEPPPPCRGRFAPSPTGPLHFGSLVAAVGSYLDARHRRGEWLVRIEDLDPPREVAGATDDILRTLEHYGLYWDGALLYQSRRTAHYESALESLAQTGRLFGCACTRRELAGTKLPGAGAGVYPGTCRNGLPAGRSARSLRVRVDNATVTFRDRLQGEISQPLDRVVGDFVVRRADRLTAYQLAVVVDDADQNITEIVRGADLLDSTPRQIFLQRLLGLATPAYLHLPLAASAGGDKLGKQTRARAIGTDDPATVLRDVLRFLNQPLPDPATDATVHELLRWAIDHWDTAVIHAGPVLTAPDGY